MKFKQPQYESQFEALPEKLREICYDFEQLSVKNAVIPVVTRVTDPVHGESGVHPQHRAVDFRNQYSDGKVNRWLYPQETVQEIVETLNKKYPRTDGKLVCIHHSFAGGPFHYHVQIPYAWLTEDEKERLYGSDKLN